jgi:DNA-binding transcriptional MerR regulator
VRVYGERERVRLKLVLRGKRLGLALAEIAELLDLYEIARNERAQLAKFLDLLADRRGRLMQQKEDIDAVLAEIDGVEKECRRRLKEDRRGGTGSGTRAGRPGWTAAAPAPERRPRQLTFT